MSPAAPEVERPLSDEESRLVEAARARAFQLYDGVEVAHRSCGIAMAETFSTHTPPYQALRKGGLTGLGPCGVVQAGRQLLGEFLGDPDPSGATTAGLLAAMTAYDAQLPERVRRATCATLTAPLGPFSGTVRHDHCAVLAAETAALLAEVLLRHGIVPQISLLEPKV